MLRTHCYSTSRQRCYGKYDYWGAKGRTNAIGALIGKDLLTVNLFEQNTNTEVFISWIEQNLISKLLQSSVVVMDNASFHKNKNIREQLESAGHILDVIVEIRSDI